MACREARMADFKRSGSGAGSTGPANHTRRHLRLRPFRRRGRRLHGTGLDERLQAEAQALWSWANTLAGLFMRCGPMGAIQFRPAPAWIFWFSVMYVIGAGVGSPILPAPTPDHVALSPSLHRCGVCADLHQRSRPLVPKKTSAGLGSGSPCFGGLVSPAIMLLLFVEQANGKTLIGLAPASACSMPKVARHALVGPSPPSGSHCS